MHYPVLSNPIKSGRMTVDDFKVVDIFAVFACSYPSPDLGISWSPQVLERPVEPTKIEMSLHTISNAPFDSLMLPNIADSVIQRRLDWVAGNRRHHLYLANVGPGHCRTGQV